MTLATPALAAAKPDDAHIAIIGDITNIKRQIETLEAENPQLLPFTKKIRHFITEIRLDLIERLIKPYLLL